MKKIWLSCVLALPLAAAGAGQRFVRSIQYEKLAPLTIEEIQGRFGARGAKLSIDHPYEPRDVDEVAHLLQQLLAEHGRGGVEIRADMLPVGPRGIVVTFRAVEPDGRR